MTWAAATPSAAAQFQRDPLQFMNDNIIVVGFEGDDVAAPTTAPMDLCLAKRNANVGKASQMGRELGLYAIGPKSFCDILSGVESISPPFKAYFCPYRGGKTLGTVLSSAADFMLTTQMDGCSLGIGTANVGGDRLVYHSNVGGNVPAQQQQLDTKFGGAANIETTWSPASYRMEYGQSELCCTTFGVRDPATNQWKFYGQTYQRAYTNPDKYYLREVKVVL